MIPTRFTPPPDFDLPPGRLELRRHHLVAEIAAARSPRPGISGSRLRRARRRWPLVALAPIAAVVAVLALLLVSPWPSRGLSVVDRALAAVGTGPVVHAVVEYSWPQDIVVDLATGTERERIHRDEFWYDEQRRELFHRSVTDGGQATYYLIRDGLPDRLDPALAGFATQYRDALSDRQARVVGDVTVEGRPAKRIEFAPNSGGTVEEVVVDARTYAPLRFQSTYPGGRRSPEWRVVTVESVSRDLSTFAAPETSPPQPSSGEVSDGRDVSLAEATNALGAPALWLGPSFAGQRLGSVELARTTASLTDGSKISGVLVRLVYGPVRVSLARDPAGRYAIGFGENAYPVPPEGSIAVTGNDREGWIGELRHGDFSVMLNAPHKEQLLTAARALTPQQ